VSRLRKRFLDCSNMTLAEAEQWGKDLIEVQRDIMFQIGDLARFAEAKWPDTHQQIWPEWVSPGLLSRAAGVCRAYPKEEDRQVEATYSQFMQVASRPDRLERLAKIVDAGLTTDESRKELRKGPGGRPLCPKCGTEEGVHGGCDCGHLSPKQRWLLAVDVHYFLNRFWYSGAGVEAAVGVSTWVQRTVNRLKEKGLTDCACCFDSKVNHRKEFTKDWEDRYKDRPPKDAELVQQLNLVYDLLKGAGFACALVDGMEADDVMASYAKQFQGRVTILTQDKDCRQCLSEKCNMLLDVEWLEDPTSGEHLPEFKWLSMKQHTETTGIPPAKWIDLQMIMGDTTDGIKGSIGIGEAGATNLVKTFGSVTAAIQAAKDNDPKLLAMKRGAAMAKSLIEFEAKAEVTRKLVTLRTDLELPGTTRI